jgi:hypothetical protein
MGTWQGREGLATLPGVSIVGMYYKEGNALHMGLFL